MLKRIRYASILLVSVLSNASPLPPHAERLGFTHQLINEKPQSADISFISSSTARWFNGTWYTKNPPSRFSYGDKNQHLTLSLGGNISSAFPTTGVGLIPLLPGSSGFYIEFTSKISSNNPDHWPALWLLPIEHNGRQDDRFPDDNYENEHWMEFDIDEGGFGRNITGSVHAWSGNFPKYKRISNQHKNFKKTLNRTHFHKFALSFEPDANLVSWYLDDKLMQIAGPPAISKYGKQHNYYIIISAQSHKMNIPYTMEVSSIRAYTKPGSDRPQYDSHIIPPQQ